MIIERIKTLGTLNDVKNSAVNIAFSEILNNDTFKFLQKYNLIEHKKASTTSGQYFAIRLDDLQIGDIVEVEFDYYKVNGADINLLLKEAGDVNGINNVKLYSTGTSFTSVKYRFTTTKETIGNLTQIEIGYATGEVGQYKIKNVRVRIIDKYVKPHGVTTISGLFYKQVNGEFMFHDGFANNGLSFEVNGNNLRLKFKTANKRAMLNINKLALGNTLDYDFYQVLGQNTYCEFAVFQKGTNTKVNLADLLSKEIWLNLSIIVEY